MDSHTARRTDPSRPILALAIALLVLNLIILWVGAAPAAHGQQAARDAEPIFNSTADRRRMIEQLQQLNERFGTLGERLGRIEQKLDKGLDVRVTQMPAQAPEGK
jgi:hypothetical protein